MSKIVFAICPGHGGIIDGINQSKDGKYSPKFTDATKFEYNGQKFDRFYEGANNRILARMILEHLNNVGLEAVDITGGSDLDVPLSKRVDKANELFKTHKVVYISIHSDALGNGEAWQPASGISVYTSKGQTKSDIFASIVIDELQENYGKDVKWRTDETDTDKDKEENFYVLAKTNCPSILIEGGFHTNEAEVKKMMTAEWRVKFVNAVTNACLKWEHLFA